MMSPKEIAGLKARWTTDALAASDRAFSKMDPVAAYQRRPPPYPFLSPFGECNGYADFRYLPMGVIPANRTIERADLTGATDARNGQLGRCTWIECIFDRASMETNLGDRAHRCSFVRARLTHTTLRGEFVDCDFSGSDLSYSGGGQLKFIRCNFNGAKFTGSGFDYCSFDGCTWDGAKIGNAAFAHCRFIGGRPNAEQLVDAMTPGASFD